MSRALNSLSDQVDQAIQNNPYLLGRTLRFETHGDRIVLKGVVGSYFQKQMAQEALRHIHGVVQIENHLEVARS